MAPDHKMRQPEESLHRWKENHGIQTSIPERVIRGAEHLTIVPYHTFQATRMPTHHQEPQKSQ